MSFQPPGRQQLHRELVHAWENGKIAVSKNIQPELFISEADQIATALHVKLETKIVDGRCYAMANEGLPLRLHPESEYGKKYKQINPQYRINQVAWTKLGQGLEL
jgi:hypothetical protein